MEELCQALKDKLTIEEQNELCEMLEKKEYNKAFEFFQEIDRRAAGR
jgi:hypothetical protein